MTRAITMVTCMLCLVLTVQSHKKDKTVSGHKNKLVPITSSANLNLKQVKESNIAADDMNETTKLSDNKIRNFRSITSFCQTQECLRLLLALEQQMMNQTHSLGVYNGRW